MVFLPGRKPTTQRIELYKQAASTYYENDKKRSTFLYKKTKQ